MRPGRTPGRRSAADAAGAGSLSRVGYAAEMESSPRALRERSAELRAEALSILAGGARATIEASLGPVEVAGSVALDLMVLPDIDLYVRAEAADAPRARDLLLRLAAQLAGQGYPTARLSFRDEHLLPDPAFPDTPGIYLGVEAIGPGRRRWKIDLWGWDEQRHAAQRERHLELRRSLERADRDLILRIKEPVHPRPGYRGVDVYAFALADAGSSLEDFDRFLRRRGAQA